MRRYNPHNALHPTIGADWDFHIAQHGSNWVLERHIVREHGVIVYGPSPDTLIDPVSQQELRQAVCQQLKGFWLAQLDAPAWLRPRDYQAFATLTMCRALYTLHEGVVASKPVAATWAKQALDPTWQMLIDRALRWRHEHAIDDLTETLAFLSYAIECAKDMCEIGNQAP